MKILLSLRREIPEDVELYEGVGLLKSEHSDMKHHLNDDSELKNIEKYIRKICNLFYPKPVWYRTSDASTSFVNALKGDKVFIEKNPHFGLRGIRRSLVCSEAFTKEVQMIQSIRDDYDNLNILFPFVNHIFQYIQALRIAKSVGYNGRSGIMVELPSALLTLDEFIDAGVDYMVFGMNDLTDCIEGCSRKNTETASLIYRDKTLKATRRLLDYVTWDKHVEYVLSGDINPATVQLLKRYGFQAVAIPYYQIGKGREYTMTDLKRIRRLKQ